MSNTSMSKMKWVAVSCIWLMICGVCVMGYRWVFVPRMEEEAKAEESAYKKSLLKRTSSKARYENQVTINLDSFSGYSVIRSPEFMDELGSRGIGLNLIDDNANYTQRLIDIRDGNAQFAAFTIDALIKASKELNEFPGVIIFVIDESVGADAAIGVERTLANIDALNSPETKFVLVPDSPSETLARVIIANFGLDKLSEDPFIPVNSAQELYDNYRNHKPTDKNIFVTWEPNVTKMATNPDYKVFVDSSKFRGYILDVMVVSRDFLVKNPKIVYSVTTSYFRSLYKLRNNMDKLLVDDALSMGDPIKPELAEVLNKKIRWKNTRENYGHFGVVKGTGLRHMDDMIRNIVDVLVQTKDIDSDPLRGRYNQLYYSEVLQAMLDANFHPGNLGSEEDVRGEKELEALSDADWNKLDVVGTLKVDHLVFPRGTAILTPTSKNVLDKLVKKLQDAPQFYLLVTGNASTKGDLEANTKLAMSRANAAKDYLIEKGIASQRIKAVGGEPSGETVVNFVVGQMPY